MPKRSLTREEIRQAAEDLKARGIVPSRENIAEQAAMRGDEAPKRHGPAARVLTEGRGGPSSEIAKRKQAEADAKRRHRQPPADVLRRFREKHGG